MKKSPEISNIGELAELVIANMAPYGVRGEILRLAGLRIHRGTQLPRRARR